jgi:cation diffusion facilitator CzcD-associated flavoprotein CzcO
MASSTAQQAKANVPLSQHHAYKKRKLRVATIGAGFSGLIFAHKLQHEQPELQDFVEHVIFEANDGIGGTWRVNTYPGVQCDIPAHLYVSSLIASITNSGRRDFEEIWSLNSNPMGSLGFPV